MSYLGEPNKDAIDGAAVNGYATGSLVGFLENYQLQYNSEARAASAYSVEKYMADAFDEQRQSALKLGIEGLDIGALSNGLEIMEYYNGSGKEPELAALENGIVKRSRLADYDRRVDELKKKYPTNNFRTTKEMSDYVKSQAREAERLAATARPTALGYVGGFAGGAVANLNPDLNPINFLTLPIGAFGKTVATRIATQGGAQGGVESINQLTGVQRERKALGLSSGFADAAARIGAAAAGGAALQGIGEAVVFGAKKWFVHTPSDPAPLPPPEIKPDAPGTPPRSLRTPEQEAAFEASFREASGGSRAGALRSAIDLEHVRKQLDTWSAESPVNIRPPDLETATRFPREVDPGFEPAGPNARIALAQSNLEDLARRADPQIFSKVDGLHQQQAELRRMLDEARPTEAQANATLRAVDDRIEELTDKVKNKRFSEAERTAAGGRAEAKAQAKAEIEKLKGERDAEFKRLTSSDTEDMAAIRERIQKNDEKLRDYAPVLSRAYARAQDKWALQSEYNDLFRRKVTQGRMPTADELKALGTYEEAAALTLAERVPMMARAGEVADKLREGADAVDTMTAVVAKDAEVFDEAMQSFRDSVVDILSRAESGAMKISDATDASAGEFVLRGIDHKFNLDDTVLVPVENGEGFRTVTMREVLEDIREADLDAKAVQTCSM